MSIENANIIKILFLVVFSSGLAVAWTPLLTNFLYKHKLWRKSARKTAIDGKPARVFHRLHKEREVKVPRLGGLLIWVTTTIVTFLFAWLATIDGALLEKLNFLSRDQTWLPLATLIAASLLGLADDLLVTLFKNKYQEGLKLPRRLAIVFLIGAVGALWFYFKLGGQALHIPLVGSVHIGIWYIPLFIIVVLATWAGGIIDGIDGLAGGTFAIMFSGFSIIAFSGMQYNIAAFCAVIVGTILAFLWFNIPPARFYMGETGMIGLTATLAVVAFLTNSVIVLPIIGGLLVIEVGSVIIQLISKKWFGKKIFYSTPLHHHLEAKGWPPEKVTMRFWILGMVFTVAGVAIKLLG